MFPLLPAISGKATGFRNRLTDLVFEQRLNIQTFGTQDIQVADAVPYSTFAYEAIGRILDHLDLTADDVFVDVGCGKGRVVCLAALRPLRRIVGVEIDDNLHRQARNNAQQMRFRLAPVEIVHVPAQEYHYRECTAMFLFNPFGYGTLQGVLGAAIDSLRANPRPFRLAYVNPRHDRALHDAGEFERYDHWPLRPWNLVKFEVSFWRWIGNDSGRVCGE